ncbi:MAG: ParB N-terminal domain-containing protein [Streptosporangiaceae bacterium]
MECVGGTGEPCLVPIGMLREGESPRLAGVNPGHAEILASTGAVLPPILVHRETMRIVDGMHRLRAAGLRGDKAVEVRFFDGDDNEAFVAAVRANIAHGLALTVADREAAAARIIGSERQRSDRWIAAVTGLAPGTVGAVRRRADATGDPVTARVGRDGRVRPLSSADGRLLAREEITRHPDASLRAIAAAAGISPATAMDVRDRMRRGEDPVPSGQRTASRVTPRTSRPGAGPAPRGAGPDLASALQELGKDPSLRYTQSGRELLRWLEFEARGPGAVQALVHDVPPHCRYLIAALARRCAGQWQDLAASLECQLHDIGNAEQARLRPA